MNQLIHSVTDLGMNKLLYDIFFAFSFVVVIVYTLINCKNYKLTKKKALLFTVCVYALSLFWMFFLYWVESGFRNWGGNNIVRVFIWIPVAAYPFCKLMDIDWRQACDFLAPCPVLIQGVSHYGCIFQGCCNGYPFKHGIWNPDLQYNCFPIQPVEACVAVIIAVYVLYRQKKIQYQSDGLTYPIMMMLFGYSRFFLEFLRDNDKLFLGISGLAIHALAMGIVGTAVYGAVKSRKGNRRR